MLISGNNQGTTGRKMAVLAPRGSSETLPTPIPLIVFPYHVPRDLMKLLTLTLLWLF